MDTIRLRRGPDGDFTLDLTPTRDSFAVVFRNRVSGSQAAKSMLKMPFVLGRNLQARDTNCPSGLALFRMTPDRGSTSMPGMGDPVTGMRDSAMNYIRSQVRRPDSRVTACYHVYRRANHDHPRADELVPSGSLYLEFHRLLPYEFYREIFDNYHLIVDRAITYWDGAFVVSVTQDTGSNPLRLAEKLLMLKFEHAGERYSVFDYVDPVFHRHRSLPAIPRDPVFNYQWHLRNDGLSGGKTGVDIRVPEAWDITLGREDVKVAVIDDAFDLTSRSFRPERIVAPLNVHDGTDDVSPTRNADEWHGTSVLGLISAAHGSYGGCGIAPNCPVIPIKLEALVDDDAEARAFDHAVENGAAVINCSWGPYDDYSQDVWPMPRLTELAIENAYRNRVAIVFAAGNGSEDMKNDGYAAHPCVVAVAATTDCDDRADYSDYGERVWVCAPSSGGGGGIVTTDVREGGYNVFGDLTPDFGGTSASAPIVSGVIALMQSAFLDANPKKERLTVEEVRAILRMNARREDRKNAPKIKDYWSHELIDPNHKRPDGHSLAFGYGCVDAAACVRAAAKWKRGQKNPRPLDGLESKGAKVATARREPKIDVKRPMGRVDRKEIQFKCPRVTVDDPLARFHRTRESGLDVEHKSRFNSGEHVWLGTQGFREACDADPDMTFQDYATILRGESGGKQRFSYGEIVALSGDFYKTPDELFYEKPTWLSWLWEDSDTSDLRRYFRKELEVIKQQMNGADVKYPDYNVEFWWNAKNYTELAKNNESHFGWHNMMTYCAYHTWALDLAVRASTATGNARDDLWRKCLYYNGFADHFLTDGFAAGHIRVPRREIRDWAAKEGFGDTTGGFLSKLLHDQDGHRDTDHSDGEDRGEEDGLHVVNSNGDDWWTRCDGQLFIQSEPDSPRLRQPIEAVKQSVRELFQARRAAKLPEGVFAATRHVPFPHPDEVLLTEKFNANDQTRLRKWVKAASWYEFGVNVKNVKKLFEALPDLMRLFQAAVKNDAPKVADRLPAEYIEAFSKLS